MLTEVGRPSSVQRVDRFAHLQCISHSVAQWLIHIRDDGRYFAPCPATNGHHHLSQFFGFGLSLHESPFTHLHVKDNCISASGDLFAHDAAGNERHTLDSTRHIAQGVELAIGRS